MKLDRAIALAAAADEPQLRRAYRVAVARGGNNTGCAAEEERFYGTTLRLLTLALLRLPDLAVCVYTLHLVDEAGGDPAVARVAGDVAAGALRLAYRALEVHGRDVGYQTGAWVDRALLAAGVALDGWHGMEGDEIPEALEEARAATIALTRAAGAIAGDRVLVAEQLTDGVGHLLVLYLIARCAAE